MADIEHSVSIVRTTDGSCTLYLPELDETYHSKHGALAESLHVYIRNGLDRLAGKEQVNILEIGFGTGLNTLLTLDHKPAGQRISYITLEPYPLDKAVIGSYYAQFEVTPKTLDLLPLLLNTRAEIPVRVREDFEFLLLKKKLEDLTANDVGHRQFDLVYYDAFGPSKQPGMWTEEILGIVTALMNKDSVFVTYCAQGQFKRNLKSLGLTLTHPEGPWGKREMTVGIKS